MAEFNVDNILNLQNSKTNLVYKMYCGSYGNNEDGEAGCHYYNINNFSDTMCYEKNSLNTYRCMMDKMNELKKHIDQLNLNK